MIKRVARLSAVLAGAMLAACAVGPDYQRPAVPTSPAFKEAGEWKPTEPNDILTRGPWWTIYNDEVLSQLEEQIDISNQTVKAAAAAFEQSRALVAQARAGLWPTISGTFGLSRSGSGAGGAVITGNTGTGTTVPATTTGTSTTTYSAGISGSWEPDIWGRVRRGIENSRASAQVSAALLAGARLSAQAALATDYFQLRVQDQLQKLLDDTVDAETRSLQITQSRYKFGVAARADVVSAETQLLSSQSQQVNARIQRGVLEHAIAVLLGKQPAEFSLAASTMRNDVPTVPAGVPSELLERRPDVAEAERQMAAANAQVGVATAAWYPSLTLSGQAEYQGGTLSRLFRVSNRVWSVGPSLAETIIDGGLRSAQVRQARFVYEQDLDNYRQTVLAGFQQVEDDIITLRVLEEQAVIEDKTVTAAREAEALTLNQYKAGTVPYSSVITAQTTRLSAEQTALQVLSNRLTSSVGLIQALGGGWQASDLPIKP